MRSGIHPAYRRVLFADSSSGTEWVGYSTMNSSETKAHGGESLPIIRLDISSASHPFWTGQTRSLDSEGRIDRFKRRYAAKR
jgi:large subunit ribosomal protein L31